MGDARNDARYEIIVVARLSDMHTSDIVIHEARHAPRTP